MSKEDEESWNKAYYQHNLFLPDVLMQKDKKNQKIGFLAGLKIGREEERLKSFDNIDETVKELSFLIEQPWQSKVAKLRKEIKDYMIEEMEEGKRKGYDGTTNERLKYLIFGLQSSLGTIDRIFGKPAKSEVLSRVQPDDCESPERGASDAKGCLKKIKEEI